MLVFQNICVRTKLMIPKEISHEKSEVGNVYGGNFNTDLKCFSSKRINKKYNRGLSISF